MINIHKWGLWKGLVFLKDWYDDVAAYCPQEQQGIPENERLGSGAWSWCIPCSSEGKNVLR